MTETVKQGKSLLERWHYAAPHKTNSDFFPDREKLKDELKYLLKGQICEQAGLDNYEANYYKKNEELLKEFNQNFTWKQKETVMTRWSGFGDFVQYQDFDSRVELFDYICQDKELIDAPEGVDPYDIDFDWDRASEVLPEVRLINFQPIKALKKSFEVVINVQGENWDEEEIDRHFNLLFGEDVSGLQFDLKKVIAVQEQCPSV